LLDFLVKVFRAEFHLEEVFLREELEDLRESRALGEVCLHCRCTNRFLYFWLDDFNVFRDYTLPWHNKRGILDA